MTASIATLSGPAFDVERIRADFPILAREVHGKPLIYVDNAATTQKPQVVIDRIDAYYAHENANIHRGVHSLSAEATAAYEAARETVARFVNARAANEIVFTRGTTEAINLVAQSYARPRLGPDDEILITALEHHSNIVPWQMIAAQTGAIVKYVPFTVDGLLDMDALPRLLNEKTRIFAFTAMSNVFGTINPVKELVSLARQAGAISVVDAAQSVPHLPVDVQDLDCDFLAFSGHKMCGPTGIGILYGRRKLLEAMPPFMGGGDMIRRVRLEGSTWNDLPWKFEAGTPAIAEAVGLGAAVDYLRRVGMAEIHAHEQFITSYALEALSEVPGMTLLGPPAPRKGGVAAFTLAGIHAHDVAEILDKDGVAVRAGHHCAMPLHHKLGVSASVRASFYLYTTTAEIDTLVQSLQRARQVFRL